MNLRTFDLNLLKVLDALLREGSTVRAGQVLGLSQPAVSAALGRLREAFGDPLLVRQGQRLQPTDLALTLAAPVAAVLEDAGGLLARPTFDPATAEVFFRIAAADFFTEMLLPSLMARLSVAAPGAQLRFTDTVGVQTMDDLRNGRIDLHLIPRLPFPPWSDSRTAFRTAFVIVARTDHPVLTAAGVTPAGTMPVELYCTLRHATFQVVERAMPIEDEVLGRLGMQRRVVLSVPSFAAVWRAVAATDLVGMVPRRLAERVAPGAGLSIHPMPIPIPMAELCQIWHRRDSARPAHVWLRREVGHILSAIDDGEAEAIQC